MISGFDYDHSEFRDGRMFKKLDNKFFRSEGKSTHIRGTFLTLSKIEVLSLKTRF